MLKPIVAVLIAAGAATAAHAQPTSDPQAATSNDEEIVVQGVRPSTKQVRAFVRALTDVRSSGQLSRFHLPACPAVMGLAPAQNDRIVERMRRVAEAARIPLAPARCSANTFVIVTPDKAAAIAELNRRFPAYFSQMSDRDMRRLAADTAPAAAWQVKTLMTADRELAAKATASDAYIVKSVNTPSRIKAASMPTFMASVVVIDVKSAAGLTVTQLADYAAMRTFADIDPQRVVKTGVPSILGALTQPDDQALPVTLTHWDLGFLKSLYTTDNAYLAGFQRGDMERVVKKELHQSGRDKRR